MTDLAVLRRRIDVPIAADESVHLSADPLAVRRLEAADVVVLKAAPLGGVRRALVLAEKLDLPAVVCSALDTSVCVGAGLRLAAALPVLEYACGLGTVGLLSSYVAIPSVLPVRGLSPAASCRCAPSASPRPCSPPPGPTTTSPRAGPRAWSTSWPRSPSAASGRRPTG